MRRQEIFSRDLPEGLHIGADLEASRGSFFGVGLASRRPSAALPIDTLALIFAQEMVRRELRLEQSFILLADSNAVAAGFDPEIIDGLALHAERVLALVLDHLGMQARLLRASSVERAVGAPAVSANRDPSEYVERQLLQTRLMRQLGVTIKVGWAMSGCARDERRPDAEYRRRWGADALTSVQAVCGRTLDERRPRACPYQCPEPAERLLLAPGERLADKLERAEHRFPRAVRGYRRLLAKLARAWHHLGGPSAGSPEELFQPLVDELITVQS